MDVYAALGPAQTTPEWMAWPAQWLGQLRQWLGQLRQWQGLGNTLDRWLIALAIAVAAYLALRLLAKVLSSRIQAIANRRQIDWLSAMAELLKQVRRWFLLLAAIYFGSLALDLPTQYVNVIRAVAASGLLLQATLWGNALLTFAVQRYMQRRLETDAATATTIKAVGFLARVALWAVAILMVLDQLGFEITTMLAGLGIGGVAIALASQNILGDLFASMSIVLDKPFVLGDFILVGDKVGSVEHIGLKTTRLRALSGEQLVFSNNDLLASRIHNFKRMNERRILFTLGVTYQTPADKLARIPQIIREVVELQEQTRFDRAHFKQYGDFALLFETVYYVLSPDYSLYMDAQQAINMALFQRFEAEAIEFAYPTQMVYLAQVSAG